MTKSVNHSSADTGSFKFNSIRIYCSTICLTLLGTTMLYSNLTTLKLVHTVEERILRKYLISPCFHLYYQL